MVSQRCKVMVKSELTKIGLEYSNVELGMAELLEEISPEKRVLLKANLKKSGLELLEDKRIILVEKIKNVIIEMIHYTDDEPTLNFSEYLASILGYDYTYMSNVFSEVKGMTIQHFLILNKIEKAKELILYNELSLSEIAFRLHYSSAAHLSNQFKKVTGLTPSFFKRLKQKRILNLESL